MYIPRYNISNWDTCKILKIRILAQNQGTEADSSALSSKKSAAFPSAAEAARKSSNHLCADYSIPF